MPKKTPSKKKKELSPLMEQYWSMKSAHADKILFFRMGDFFEMFYEDAQTAAPLLGIALTSRNKKSGDHTPMCGMPHHSVAGAINKLLAHGHKVALCDQVEDAKLAKGLVKRAVTRILSPGMVYDPEQLTSDRPNYLVAFDDQALSFMEPTTGECFYYLTRDPAEQRRLVEALAPVELVYAPGQEVESWVVDFGGVKSMHDSVESTSKFPESARRLLSYAPFMQGESLLRSLRPFERRECLRKLQLSSNTLRHLEVFRSYKGETEGTLFAAVNRTKTAGGARLLRQWLQFPLTNLSEIGERQGRIASWLQKLEVLKSVRRELSYVGDLERKLGKISQPHCHPRDLQALGESLNRSCGILKLIGDEPSFDLAIVEDQIRDLERTFVGEIPNNFRDGSFIASGVDSDLDGFIEVAQKGQQRVRDLEERERQSTGISSLKVRYNNVFGYYIEVTNTHKKRVPGDRYMRKQTLTNAERYATDELNELEKKVLTAKTKRTELELQIFARLKGQIMDNMPVLMQLAQKLNNDDTLSGLAWLALENNYVRPEIIEGGRLELKASRHPVIEQFLESSFIANDISLEPEQCLLLTGPNMAGKSTVMRQVALTCLLAQMGSFVPADEARLPLVDKIFTRIGASDFLTEGLSTFMVEMQETAEMLSQATNQSLVILDEVGRGTSTYDGMSLAQSILEHFVQKIRPWTFFATHYHELVHLEEKYPGKVLNQHMAISDRGARLHFLYRLTPGPALKSYGIQVAQLAGIPKEVVSQAKSLLSQLESKSGDVQQLDLFSGPSMVIEDTPGEAVLSEEGEKAAELRREVLSQEIQKMTPLDALNKISQWQRELS